MIVQRWIRVEDPPFGRSVAIAPSFRHLYPSDDQRGPGDRVRTMTITICGGDSEQYLPTTTLGLTAVLAPHSG